MRQITEKEKSLIASGTQGDKTFKIDIPTQDPDTGKLLASETDGQMVKVWYELCFTVGHDAWNGTSRKSVT